MLTALDLPTIATRAAHYASPGEGHLAAVVAAVQARRSLEGPDGWLPAASTAYLRNVR